MKSAAVEKNAEALEEFLLPLGAVLVTNNVREFRRIPGLKVEDWVN